MRRKNKWNYSQKENNNALVHYFLSYLVLFVEEYKETPEQQQPLLFQLILFSTN